MTTFAIAGRNIGPSFPTYIVAEMSANHGGSLEHAKRVVLAAKAAGADAIKLQTYTADSLTIDSDAPPFRVNIPGVWDGRLLHSLYDEAHTPWDWQPALKALADEIGIHLFSTPFDFKSLDFLADMDVPAFKIASPEMNDIPLIERVAKKGKPIIMSTGMSTLDEVVDAVRAVRRGGGDVPLALLKCTSAYPAPFEEMNLSTIPHLAQTFRVVTGLSDHTMGSTVPIAAVALGARIIEKHFCLSRSEGGPDSSFSMEPEEFAQMVRDVRNAESALGSVGYELGAAERETRKYRRSLFVVRDIAPGELFTEENVRSIRPATGLPPKYLGEVLGRRAARALSRGEPLAWDMLGPRDGTR